MSHGFQRFFPLLYAAATAAVIIGAETGASWMYFLFKPLLMLILLVYFRQQVPSGQGKLVAGALAFSLCGDVLLMFDNRDVWYFVVGMAFFMLAHFCYLAFFVLDITRSRPWNQHWFQMALATVLVVYAVEFYILNRSGFGQLWSPVMVYIILIAAMGIAAVMRDRTRPSAAYQPIVAGAVCFITSDSLLAVNKFVMEIPHSGLWVLTLYALAQWLLVIGILRVYRYRNSVIPGTLKK